LSIRFELAVAVTMVMATATATVTAKVEFIVCGIRLKIS
jgi:hypothetical protein